MKRMPLASPPHGLLAGLAAALLATPGAAQGNDAPTAVLPAAPGFAETAEPFLARYCVRCHGPRQQKGGLRLDTLSPEFGEIETSETWRQVFYRLRFDEMPPPSTKNQPGADDKQAMLRWIDDQLIAEGRGIHLAEKMRLPQFGNYVDHEQLFSGEVDEPPYTDARLWRQRPQIYADLWGRPFGSQHRLSVKVGGAFREGDIHRVQFGPHAGKTITLRYFSDERYANPFYEFVHHASGITDYADIAADQASLEALLTNAERMAEILTVGQPVAITTEVKTKDSRHGNNHGMFVGGEVTTSTERRGEVPAVFRAVMRHDGTPPRALFDPALELAFELFLRRTPADHEFEHYYQDLFLENVALDNTMALQAVLVAVAISPEFVYRMEMGLGEEDEHGRRMLSPLELVFAIQYAFDDRSPFGVDAFPTEQVFDKDVEPLVQRAMTEQHGVTYPRHGWLVEQMRAGRLQTREHVEAAVRHMVSQAQRNPAPNHNRDIRSVTNPRVLQFFREFFGYHKAAEVFKEVDSFKQRDGFRQFNNHTATRLMYDTDALVLHVLEQDRDVLYELLTTDKVFVSYWNGESNDKQVRRAGGRDVWRAAHDTQSYNLDPFEREFRIGKPVTAPAGQRCGVLTQPSWLVAHSGNFDNDPVRRGKWIREKLLAGYVMDVPITVQAVIPDSDTMTLRERFAVVHEPRCWGCHKKMNPLGMPFEQFNHVGRFRDLERGKPAVTTGAIDYTGDTALDGDISDVRQMMERLGRSDLVRQSFLRHVFRFWMGRNEDPRDSRTLRAMDRAYVESGGSFRETLVALLTSDSFLYRK